MVSMLWAPTIDLIIQLCSVLSKYDSCLIAIIFQVQSSRRSFSISELRTPDPFVLGLTMLLLVINPTSVKLPPLYLSHLSLFLFYYSSRLYYRAPLHFCRSRWPFIYRTLHGRGNESAAGRALERNSLLCGWKGNYCNHRYGSHTLFQST